MKVRIPPHREFIIDMEDLDGNTKEACWAELQQIMSDYQAQGKSIFTPTFIEDNEEKVKTLQEKYGFRYTVELKK